MKDDRNGQVRIVILLRDSGGTDRAGVDHSTQTFTIFVAPVNDAPYFSIACPASLGTDVFGSGDGSGFGSGDAVVDVLRVSCSEECLANSGGCTVQLTVQENCAGCTSSIPPCGNGLKQISLESFAIGILPSRSNSFDEQMQNVTFVVEHIGGDLKLLENSSLPVLDVGTGGLTFCLARNLNGIVSFNISLKDDGVQTQKGVGLYAGALLQLNVEAVNLAPTFEICEDCSGLCCNDIGVCCKTHLNVLMNSGITEVQNFAQKILYGGSDPYTGGDSEAHQTVTFHVSTLDLLTDFFNESAAAFEQRRQDSSTIFVQAPRIDASGTLIFELKKEVYGEVALEIYLMDDGEPGPYGSNTSQIILYTLKILNSMVELRIEIFGALPRYSSADNLREMVA